MDDLKNKGVSPDDANKKIEDVEEIAALLQKELDRAKQEQENDGLPDAVTDWDNLVDAPVKIEDIKAGRRKNAAKAEENEPSSDGADERDTGSSENGENEDDEDEYAGEIPPARYSALSVVTFLLVIGLALFSVKSVSSADISTVKSVFSAESYMRQDKVYSALDTYYGLFSQSSTPSEFAQRRLLDLCYENGYLSDISDVELMGSLNMKKPWNFKYKKIFATVSKFLSTAQEVNEIISPVMEDTSAEFDYDEIIAKLSEYENGDYDLTIISYYKYYMASLAGKDAQTQLDFLLQSQSANKDAGWLYASDMALCYRELGQTDKAIALIDKQIKKNAEDTDYTGVKIMIYRMNKDYERAAELCNEAISQNSENYEAYRQLAIINLLRGDYKTALENAKAAVGITENLSVYNILALCHLANGDTESYDSAIKTVENYSASISEDVKKYKEGSKTLEEIFLEGRGECV